MKTLGILLLLGLLSLWAELPPANGQKGDGWNCPPDPYVCIRAEPNECETNDNCGGFKICCQNRCAKRCVLPVKRGSCPGLQQAAAKCHPETPECMNDFYCPDKKKCCREGCTMRCVEPNLA